MAKVNEYVGVDDKFVPEGEQKRTHVQEPIIGSENAQKVRESITGGINKLTSEEGKAKVKAGTKKGLKIAKGIGIGYLIFWVIGIVLFLVIFIFVLVQMIGIFGRTQDKMDDINNASSSIVDNLNEATNNATTKKNNLHLHSGVNLRAYVSDDLEKIYTNNKEGEHLITVINGTTSTTDPQEIRTLANSIEDESMSKKYDITIEYGDDGYVVSYKFEEF